MTRSWTITELDGGFLIRERTTNGAGEHMHHVDRTFAAESMLGMLKKLQNQVEERPKYLESAKTLPAFTQ